MSTIENNLQLVLSDEEFRAFEKSIDKSGGPDACWPWMAGKFKRGYGKVKICGKNRKAHRVAFTRENGVIPAGILICHSCDNPPCCNPKHLFSGTNQDNADDKCRKGRQATGIKSGMHTHPESRSFGDRNGSRTKPENLRRGDNHPLRLHPECRAWGDRNGSRKYPERLKRGDENGSRRHPERLVRGEDHWTHKRPGDVVNGTAVHTAVLNEESVKHIRKLIRGGVSDKEIAGNFGVHGATIWCIRTGRTWKHVK